MPTTSKIFKDLDLDFIAHPVTGDITKKNNAEAIKRSLRNLIQLQHYEKPFNPHIGSGLRDLLFEPVNVLTAAAIKTKIETVIENFEPRVNVFNIKVLPDIDANTFNVSLEFFIKNIKESVQVDFILKRLR